MYVVCSRCLFEMITDKHESAILAGWSAEEKQPHVWKYICPLCLAHINGIENNKNKNEEKVTNIVLKPNRKEIEMLRKILYKIGLADIVPYSYKDLVRLNLKIVNAILDAQ